MKLTKRAIDAIVPDARRDIYVWDDEVHGFLLRVKPSGVRSFAIQYRNASGVSRRITIGKLGVLTTDEARKVAKQKLADVTKGGDPAEARSEDRKTMTVRQLCQTYLNACEKGLIMGKRGRRLPKAQWEAEVNRMCTAYKAPIQPRMSMRSSISGQHPGREPGGRSSGCSPREAPADVAPSARRTN
jgi:Arm DNA-binding domain